MPSTPAGRRAASAHIDLADARLGLRVLHVYVTVGEVDVANVYSAQFGVAEPGASEAGDDRAPRADPAPGFLLGVVDRRGWNDFHLACDLFPLEALVTQGPCRGA